MMKARKLSGLTGRQKAYLHTLARNNGIQDAVYRDLLEQAAGVRSSLELDSAGLDRVLDLMEALGYDVGQRHRPGRTYGHRDGMATPKQLAYLDGLRLRVFGEGEKPFLRWLERFFKVSHPRFLTCGNARKVIEGLKAMADRGEASLSEKSRTDFTGN